MTHTEQFNAIMQRNAPMKREKQQPVKAQLIGARENMNPMQTDLAKCEICGNVVSLPFEQLPNYAEVRKALLNAGASYNRSKFIFPNDAQPYIDRLMQGESVNIKKEFQFYATPDGLAKYLLSIAHIEEGEVLEPSAGQGALISAFRNIYPHRYIDYYELSEINKNVIEANSKAGRINASFKGADFLQCNDKNKYSYIIANPPFNKNQDIDHIKKMYEVCKEGGRIVTIASKHWQHSGNKKETAFRDWLDEIGAEVQEIPREAFKESGTSIATCIIIINK